jgi:hypothetical protein
MAHYLEIGISDAPFLADTDLTAKQYLFVIPASTAGYVTVGNGASNPTPIGVLQNSPSQGQEARVRVLGFTKVKAITPSGCGLAYGRFISASTEGQAVPQASETGVALLGRWLDTGLAVSSCAYGMAFVNCAGFATCAVSAC